MSVGAYVSVRLLDIWLDPPTMTSTAQCMVTSLIIWVLVIFHHDRTGNSAFSCIFSRVSGTKISFLLLLVG